MATEYKLSYTGSEINQKLGQIDSLAQKSEIPTKTSELTNDSGFITEYTETDPTIPSWAKQPSKPTYTKGEVGLGNVDNVKQYSASNPPPYPVTSVNGKTGAVQLNASDVGAASEEAVRQLSAGVIEQKAVISNLTERMEALESGEDGQPENLIVSYTDGKYMSSGFAILSSGSLTLVEAHGLMPGSKLRCTLWADPNTTANTAFGFTAEGVGVKDYADFSWTALGNDIYECTIPAGVEILKFNIYTTQKATAICYMPSEDEETEGTAYIPSYITNSVSKPLGFASGKTLIAFGDSITAGVRSYLDDSGNSAITTEYTGHYIKVFSDKLGLTLTNKALSGTTLANVAHPTEASLTADKSIYGQIISTDLSSYDFILIAGGCNDGALQITLGELGSVDNTTTYGALEAMCGYIASNMKSTAQVIFITPIPLLKDLTEPLDSYRKAVFEVAVKYGFNVVDGYQLGFPYEEGDYANVVLPDGCHPSLVGHKMYANSLLGVLVGETSVESAGISTEDWVFTLADGSTVTKAVCVG